VLLWCNNEWMNRPTNGWMDQGGSVPLVHVAAFDWRSLPSSPPPTSGRHSRDRRAGVTCELNATRRLTARQCGRSRPYVRAIWLKWRRYDWPSVRYRHSAGWMQRPRPRLPDGSLQSRTLIAVFGRYTDLLRADKGVRIIHRSTDFYIVTLCVLYSINVKKLTSLKLIVRTMRWYHSTKTAKIFWVTMDGATHGASISCPMHSYI